MVSERLEVRLDGEHRRRLKELAETRRSSISELVREMIDREYEAVQLERRLQLVREIAGMNVEDVPDPETLSKQLAQTYDLGDLY